MDLPSRWKCPGPNDLQKHLGAFTHWTLCGGHSLDLILGRKIRDHADIDIGVFRSDLTGCLNVFAKEQVFLCTPSGSDTRVPWTGGMVDPAVHDIWICDPDREHWLFQIMIFDDDTGHVFYRRDRRISWPKGSHSIPLGHLRVLNPLITFLYKANKPKIEDKEVTDLIALIEFAVDSRGLAPGYR